MPAGSFHRLFLTVFADVMGTSTLHLHRFSHCQWLRTSQVPPTEHRDAVAAVCVPRSWGGYLHCSCIQNYLPPFFTPVDMPWL